MNFDRLKNHIIDMIKEEQIKLGYRSETIRLYYPLESLVKLLRGDEQIPGGREAGAGVAGVSPDNPDAGAMQRVLETEFCGRVSGELGDVRVSHSGTRFCFLIPPEGAAFVHDNTAENEFLVDFIRVIGTHGCTIDQVLEQFRKHSSHVRVERRTGGDFDYLIWFADGVPDSYRYCITDEGHHLIYHRFTAEDYEELYGG